MMNNTLDYLYDLLDKKLNLLYEYRNTLELFSESKIKDDNAADAISQIQERLRHIFNEIVSYDTIIKTIVKDGSIDQNDEQYTLLINQEKELLEEIQKLLNTTIINFQEEMGFIQKKLKNMKSVKNSKDNNTPRFFEHKVE